MCLLASEDEAVFLEEDIAEIAEIIEGGGDIKKLMKRLKQQNEVSPTQQHLSELDWVNLQLAAELQGNSWRGVSEGPPGGPPAAGGAASAGGDAAAKENTHKKETATETKAEEKAISIRARLQRMQLQREMQLQAELMKQTQRQKKQLLYTQQQLQRTHLQVQAAEAELRELQAAAAAAAAERVHSEVLRRGERRLLQQRRAAAIDVLSPLGVWSDIWAKRAQEDPASKTIRVYVQPYLFLIAGVLLAVLYFEAHKAAKAAPTRPRRSYKQSGDIISSIRGVSLETPGQRTPSIKALAAAAAELAEPSRSRRSSQRSSRK